MKLNFIPTKKSSSHPASNKLPFAAIGDHYKTLKLVKNTMAIMVCSAPSNNTALTLLFINVSFNIKT